MQNNNQPVAWMYSKEDKILYFNHRNASLALQNGYKETPLYTHPHQWQGLTDDEVRDVRDRHKGKSWIEGFWAFYKDIEQALKEKNHD
jgi:hypothetical protein